MNEKIIGQISAAQPFGIPFDPIGHDVQAIYVATGALLDAAINCTTLNEALQLAATMRVLRERVDAVSNRALDRMNELTGGMQ